MSVRVVAFALAWLAPALAFAQHFHHHVESAAEDDKRISVCKKEYAEAKPDDGIRKVAWKVHTSDPNPEQALRFFQQGMTQFYGFNYEDALQSFRRAIDFDANFAMAYWGIAMAAAPNINIAQDEDCGRLAFDASRKAQELAGQQRGRISQLESDLIDALVRRYSDNPKDRVQPVDYAVAMASAWMSHKPDPNVGAIYAEALLNLRPWALFDNAQREAIDTGEVVTVLSEAIKQPDSIGANHYWIHAVEAGPKPESAKDSAAFLDREGGSSGHLLHMPSHTYLLMGDYSKAVDANTRAIEVDRKRFDEACKQPYAAYIKAEGCQQLYYGHYGAHDLFFRSVAEAFLGRLAKSLADARATRAHVERFVVNEPGLQRYMTAPYLVMAGYGMWQPILDEKEPPTDCYIQPPFTRPTGCRILRSMWRWARGMAYTSIPKPRLDLAGAELIAFLEERGRIQPPDPAGWGNNSAAAVLAVAEDMLRARIAWASGKRDVAIEHLKLGVSHEDAMVYDEPPQWFFPVRQSLGGAYLAMDRFGDALAAFKADLERHHENGRSLYGMSSALGKLGKHEEAKAFEARYLEAWKTADPTVRPLFDEALWLLGMPKVPPAAAVGGEGSPAAGGG